MKPPSVFLFAVALAAPAFAAGAGPLDNVSPAGRYATDKKGCAEKDYFLTLTDRRMDLPTYSCEGLAIDQSENKGGRAVYRVKAKSCVGEDGKRSPDAFGLETKDGALRILWKEGPSDWLRLCAAGR